MFVDRAAQLFFTKDLLDGTSLPVDVERAGACVVLTEKREPSGRRALRNAWIFFAVLEHGVETGAANGREIAKMSVERRVDIRHQRQLRGDWVAVEIGCFVEDDESGEVDVRELREWNDIPVVAMIGDRAEDALDGLHLSGPDSGDDGQSFLLRHSPTIV